MSGACNTQAKFWLDLRARGATQGTRRRRERRTLEETRGVSSNVVAWHWDKSGVL
jgi:hypothetical protein